MTSRRDNPLGHTDLYFQSKRRHARNGILSLLAVALLFAGAVAAVIWFIVHLLNKAASMDAP